MKLKLLFLLFTFTFLLNKGIAQNVGIGTTSPVNKLDVIGNTFISGNLGIGTINPSAKLHVIGGANIQVGMGVANDAGIGGNFSVNGNTTLNHCNSKSMS